jgi:hypothetical protein
VSETQECGDKLGLLFTYLSTCCCGKGQTAAKTVQVSAHAAVDAQQIGHEPGPEDFRETFLRTLIWQGSRANRRRNLLLAFSGE